MKFRFEDIPINKSFKKSREMRYKHENECDSMTFSNKVEVRIEASCIVNEQTQKELEMLLERTMEEVKKIIAANEP